MSGTPIFCRHCLTRPTCPTVPPPTVRAVWSALCTGYCFCCLSLTRHAKFCMTSLTAGGVALRRPDRLRRIFRRLWRRQAFRRLTTSPYDGGRIFFIFFTGSDAPPQERFFTKIFFYSLRLRNLSSAESNRFLYPSRDSSFSNSTPALCARSTHAEKYSKRFSADGFLFLLFIALTARK